MNFLYVTLSAPVVAPVDDDDDDNGYPVDTDVL